MSETMSTLSETEFQRIQEQLLQLKTSNYSLEDQLKKRENEVNFWKQKSETLEKQSLNPLSLARNITRNSNKNKDLIDKMAAEIQSLQNQIESQENEFKKTNATLRQEIGTLQAEKQRLQEKVFTLKNSEEILALKREHSDSVQSDTKDEVDTGPAMVSYAVLAANEELENQVETLKQELQVLQNQKQELESSLTEALKFKDQLDKLQNDLIETSEESETRRLTIEELNKQMEQIKEYFTKELADQKDGAKQEIESLLAELGLIKQDKEFLLSELEEWKATGAKLENVSSKCESLEVQVSSLKKQLDTEKVEAQLKFDRAAEEFRERLEEETERHNAELKLLTEENEAHKDEIQSLRTQVSSLEQQVKDILEERKIHEKKGLMMVKELKRQLHSERKRAEKLQEKLEEVLSEKSYSTITIDVQPKCPNGNDSSSVGSWSFMSSKNENGENSGSESKQASPVRSTNTADDESIVHVLDPTSQLEKENSILLSKIAEVQQEKWTLEERISQLEMSNASLVKELNEKVQLIEFYCMESGNSHHHHYHSSPSTDKLTVKRVFDFIKAKGDENLKDINRRLLRMLEEILTKNMHLEKNLEILSNENMRLSKLTQAESN